MMLEARGSSLVGIEFEVGDDVVSEGWCGEQSVRVGLG